MATNKLFTFYEKVHNLPVILKKTLCTPAAAQAAGADPSRSTNRKNPPIQWNQHNFWTNDARGLLKTFSSTNRDTKEKHKEWLLHHSKSGERGLYFGAVFSPNFVEYKIFIRASSGANSMPKCASWNWLNYDKFSEME